MRPRKKWLMEQLDVEKMKRATFQQENDRLLAHSQRLAQRVGTLERQLTGLGHVPEL